ncbi:hypothetical protein QYM36_006443 [Artemia franciscana]|uniref:Reverse transcriptase domain-containing protein n=1 Tax=Artemia franciscana TaxID=6661 RepID=A0AA88I0D9_ARTSF|nr:hypothetical protein QYM36_006443 [Artemia franciscana]
MRNFYGEEFKKNASNPKATWKIINEVIRGSPAPQQYSLNVGGEIVRDLDQVCDLFAYHFSKIGETVQSEAAVNTELLIEESTFEELRGQDFEIKLEPCDSVEKIGCSTSHYLVKLFEAMVNADVRKAFDTSSHEEIFKCKEGFHPFLIKIVESFLSERKQKTKYKNHPPNTTTLTCGIPQGTKQGPTLFLLLCNMMATWHKDRTKFATEAERNPRPTGNGECTIHLKPGAVPTVHPVRRKPFALHDKLESELEQLEKNRELYKRPHLQWGG